MYCFRSYFAIRCLPTINLGLFVEKDVSHCKYVCLGLHFFSATPAVSIDLNAVSFLAQCCLSFLVVDDNTSLCAN